MAREINSSRRIASRRHQSNAIEGNLAKFCRQNDRVTCFEVIFQQRWRFTGHSNAICIALFGCGRAILLDDLPRLSAFGSILQRTVFQRDQERGTVYVACLLISDSPYVIHERVQAVGLGDGDLEGEVSSNIARQARQALLPGAPHPYKQHVSARHP